MNIFKNNTAQQKKNLTFSIELAKPIQFRTKKDEYSNKMFLLARVLKIQNKPIDKVIKCF